MGSEVIGGDGIIKKKKKRTYLCLPDPSPLQTLNSHPKFWNCVTLLLLSEVSLIQLQQSVSWILLIMLLLLWTAPWAQIAAVGNNAHLADAVGEASNSTLVFKTRKLHQKVTLLKSSTQMQSCPKIKMACICMSLCSPSWVHPVFFAHFHCWHLPRGLMSRRINADLSQETPCRAVKGLLLFQFVKRAKKCIWKLREVGKEQIACA